MNAPFTPSFRNFQQDIERQLASEGKREKNEHGQIVYRGYEAAVGQMYRTYLAQDALGPLVAEFKTWNWHWSYGSYLEVLTTRLQDRGEWPLLKQLWAAVVAKRRTNYNKTKKARTFAPDQVSDELVSKTRDLLLDALNRLRGYAAECGKESEIDEYVAMIARVERRLNA